MAVRGMSQIGDELLLLQRPQFILRPFAPDCSGNPNWQTGRLLPLRLCRHYRRVIKKFLSSTLKKLNEQPADFLWLLLFNPVSGSVKKMDAAHLRTGCALHPLKRTGHLENTPVARAGNEERGDVDRTSGIRLQVRGKSGPGTPITLK